MARKKNWVNPNVTACNHAGCHVSARSKIDKKLNLSKPTPVKVRVSRAKGMFTVG